jgi:hypothetical protein
MQADSTVTDPQVAADLKKRRTFRTFSYRGIELDKLLDLSNEEVRYQSVAVALFSHLPCFRSSLRYVHLAGLLAGGLTLCSD